MTALELCGTTVTGDGLSVPLCAIVMRQRPTHDITEATSEDCVNRDTLRDCEPCPRGRPSVERCFETETASTGSEYDEP